MPDSDGGETAQSEFYDRRIDYSALTAFYRNPALAFVRDGLDADVSVSGTASSEDTEMFEGRLDWGWKEELLRLCLETDEADWPALKHDSLQRLKANGAVPLTQQEDAWEEWSEITILAHETKSLTEAGTETIPAEEMIFEYTAADAGQAAEAVRPDPDEDETFRTTLVLPELTVCPSDGPDGSCLLVIPCFGNEISGAQLIDPIMKHLRANLSRKTRTRIVHVSNNSAAYLDAEAMENSEAKAAVKRLLYLYHAGMRTPLPFFPKSSCELFRSQDMHSAESVWNGNPNAKGEKEKFRAFFGEEMPTDAPVGELAEAFFGSAEFHEAKGGRA